MTNIRPERDPRPDQAQVQLWLDNARLDAWLALRSGFVDEATQLRRFHNRLTILSKIREKRA
jgi:hypothetical protein